MTVKQQQNLLAYLGYYTGAIDGISGIGTKAAIQAFQGDYGGLSVDGICGKQTQEAMKQAVAFGMPQRESARADFWADIRYFTKQEFSCKCGRYCSGDPAEMQEGIVRAAEKVRSYFGAPATVSSGLRCAQHNANVGGVSNSRHLSGKAVDLCVKGKTAQQVLDYVRTLSNIRYAYAIDSRFVHMDIL